MDKPNILFSKFLEDGSGLKYFEFAGTSDMAKPIYAHMAYGSKFHEVDTATIYAYDKSTQTWYKQIELGGGS